MRYSQLQRLLGMFSATGIFFDHIHGNILLDPVFIPEHPEPSLRGKIFSRSYLEQQFVTAQENFAKYVAAEHELCLVRVALARIQDLTLDAHEMALDTSKYAVCTEDELSDIFAGLENTVAHLAHAAAVKDSSVVIGNEIDGNWDNTQLMLISPGQAICPISRFAIERKNIASARDFQLCCAVLIQRALQVYMPTEKIMDNYARLDRFYTVAASDRAALAAQQKFIAEVTTAELERGNLLVDKLLLGEELAGEIHAVLSSKLQEIMVWCGTYSRALLAKEFIPWEYMDFHTECFEYSHGGDSAIDSRVYLTPQSVEMQPSDEEEVSLGDVTAMALVNSLHMDKQHGGKNYGNGVENIRSGMTGTAATAEPLRADNLEHMLRFGKKHEVIGTYCVRSETIDIAGVHRVLEIPKAPIVTPYNQLEIEGQDELLDAMPIFPLVMQVPLTKLEELPPEIRAVFNRIGINPYVMCKDVSSFVSVQSYPQKWREEKLLLRPHPWLHGNAAVDSRREFDSSCIVAVAEPQTKFMLPAMVDGLKTHLLSANGNESVEKCGISDDWRYSGKELQIGGKSEGGTATFYSVCIEVDKYTTAISKIAITLHCLLDRATIDEFNFALVRSRHPFLEVVYSQGSVEQEVAADVEIDSITVGNLLAKIAQISAIPAAEIKAFVTAHWPRMCATEIGNVHLKEQEELTHTVVLKESDIDDVIANAESSMTFTSWAYDAVLAAIKDRYMDKFVAVGGVDAIIDNLREYLISKFKEEHPKFPVEITNLADIRLAEYNVKKRRHVIEPIDKRKYKSAKAESLTGDQDWVELNYHYVNILRPGRRQDYLSSIYHAAWRLLAKRNYFMDPAAEHQMVEISAGRKRAYKSAITPTQLEEIAYRWLAVSDSDAESTDLHTSIEGRKEAFVSALNTIARAHNFEIVETEEGEIEKDNADLDLPSCSKGINSRLALSLLAHPVLEEKNAVDIVLDVRFRFKEFIVANFGEFLAGYNNLELVEIYSVAKACWNNACFIEPGTTWEEVFTDCSDSLWLCGNDIRRSHGGDASVAMDGNEKADAEVRRDDHADIDSEYLAIIARRKAFVKKFIYKFQQLVADKIDEFHRESVKKYGDRYLQQQPTQTEIVACAEFGVSKISTAKVIYKSYDQFFRRLTTMFWSNKCCAAIGITAPFMTAVINQAVAMFLPQFDALVTVRNREINAVAEHSGRRLEDARSSSRGSNRSPVLFSMAARDVVTGSSDNDERQNRDMAAVRGLGGGHASHADMGEDDTFYDANDASGEYDEYGNFDGDVGTDRREADNSDGEEAIFLRATERTRHRRVFR